MNAMHIEQLDLTQIRLLAELSRSHSVSRAAQRIGISQSAASHALAKLRRQLDDPLFTRTRDGFQPTPYGVRLCDASCEAMDVLVAGLTSRQQFDPLTTTRVFRFFMNDIGQTVFLPPLLQFLKKNAPGASARVLPVPLDNPGAALSSGEVDFAAGFFNNLTTGFFQNLVFRVPGLHVLPMIIANSDLVAVIPSRLAQAFAPRVPIKVLPPPVAMAAFDVCIHWHERYHHDPTIRWMRRAFVDLFARERR